MTRHALPVLFVDDELHNLELFRMQFEGAFAIRTAAGGEQALAAMAREPIGVLLADEQMPGMTGIDLLAHAVSRWPDTVRVIVSAYSDPPRLLRAINRGHAHEYIVKPWDKPELAACMERGLVIAERRRALIARAEMGELYERDAGEQYDTTHVIGEDGGLKDVVTLARRAAQADATLLITGETGTGKELIARLVHDASPRRLRPFVRVNCAALAEGVLESELFGHEQGAFTGAHRLRKGRFELATGGTIFLDEIGEVSAKVQATLLRVLQEKEIERVGGSSPIRVDVRVLAATHRDLRRMVRDGEFREDLYYRLTVVPLHVPALRDRKADVQLLVQHFLGKHGPRIGKIAPVDPEVYEYLEAYTWPGNVRELENMVQRALILAQGPELTVEDFAFSLDDDAAARASSRPASGSLRDELKDEERRRILHALEQCHGNQSQAARLLGMPRRTLVERLRAYGVTRKLWR
jgi:DNA-binding NtrC family response regulator